VDATLYLSAKAFKIGSGVLANVTRKISANEETSRTLTAIYAEKNSRQNNITRNGAVMFAG
tara:strand:+ start:1759 stop:1941 length:183 start_codon:yes stop_codon:yes gene_type:complete